MLPRTIECEQIRTTQDDGGRYETEDNDSVAAGGGLMTHSFEKDYWEQHWDESRAGSGGDAVSAPNPYVIRETGGLEQGTALDAGCGTGAEAIWLAAQGWQVTGADISSTALALAAEGATQAAVSDHVTWVEADLTSWRPDAQYDLVMTNYAHPAIPQLEFYRRISGWVAPGGTLLLVGHLNDPDTAEHGSEHGSDHGSGPAREHASDHGSGHSGGHPPAEATVTSADIRALLDPAVWRIDTAEERTRTLRGPGGWAVSLRDVIVRATRRA